MLSLLYLHICLTFVFAKIESVPRKPLKTFGQLCNARVQF